MKNYRIQAGPLTGEVRIGVHGKAWRTHPGDKLRLLCCPDCERKNYGPAAHTGICAWCGWDVQRALSEIPQQGKSEKESRLYYQSIVYDICNMVDRRHGGKVVCGTAENPTDDLQKTMKFLLGIVDDKNENPNSEIREIEGLIDKATQATNNPTNNQQIRIDAAITAIESIRDQLTITRKAIELIIAEQQNHDS